MVSKIPPSFGTSKPLGQTWGEGPFGNYWLLSCAVGGGGECKMKMMIVTTTDKGTGRGKKKKDFLRAQPGGGTATSLLPSASQMLLAPWNPGGERGTGLRRSVVPAPEARAGGDQDAAWLTLATLFEKHSSKTGAERESSRPLALIGSVQWRVI